MNISEKPSLDQPEPGLPGLRGHRRPLFPLVLFLSLGIVIDEYLRFPFILWMISGIISFSLGWFLLRKTSRNAYFLLILIAISCLGGAHHHWQQFIIRENDISRLASGEWKLVRIKGIVRSPIVLKTETLTYFHSTSQFKKHKTIIELENQLLKTNSGWKETTGVTRVQVEGRMENLLPGDQLELSGWLTRIQPPQNPGEFDFQTWMRRKSIRTLLFCENPLAIRAGQNSGQYPVRRLAETVRNYCKEMLNHSLSPENRSLAYALFLGDRSQISEETRIVLAESGMLHLISISGLHVGFLATMLYFLCRLFGRSTSQTAVIILLLLIFYAFMTGNRPPVLRATFLISCFFYALSFHRLTEIYHLLAFSLLVLIVFNSSVIFDTGAQLSYLAMIGLIEGDRIFRKWKVKRQQNRLEEMLRTRSGFHRAWNSIRVKFAQYAFMMLGIFFFCFPVMESRFHLVSLTGFLLNLIFMPLIGVGICSGYIILFLILFFPYLAETPAHWMNDLMTVFLNLTGYLSQHFHGHFYSPGYPVWWIVLFYLVLLSSCFVQALSEKFKQRLIVFLLLWISLGLTMTMRSSSHGTLRGTFLSVGHGTSVLFEFPNGKTLLYDAGSLNDEKRVARIVEAALWHDGYSRIDAIVISHADIDHCNAVPYLMETIPVGTLITTPAFLDFRQSIVQKICHEAYDRGIPLTLVAAPDEIQVDPDVSVRVIHPDRDKLYPSDNENSLVLLLEFKGKKILLTGDIEDNALNDLIKTQPGDFDLFMTPHHGSLSANNQETINWANSNRVLTSGSQGRVHRQLSERYGEETEFYSTERNGAIRFEISQTGEMKIKTTIPIKNSSSD